MAANNINEYIENIKNKKSTKARMDIMFKHIFSVGHENECKNIFRYENLYDDLLKLLKQHGIDASSLMEKEKKRKVNESKNLRNTYKKKEPMNQESLDFIYESCKDIYYNFGYERKFL